MSLNGSFESSSIYITMNSRPYPREYHWGLIITDASARPILHHASNRDGPWKHEERRGNPASSLTLIVIVKVARLKSISRATQVMQSVPADGTPSRRTGEAFDCRIWVKDVLVELLNTGVISLPTDIDTIETEANAYAEDYAVQSEQGMGPTVLNDAF